MELCRLACAVVASLFIYRCAMKVYVFNQEQRANFLSVGLLLMAAALIIAVLFPSDDAFIHSASHVVAVVIKGIAAIAALGLIVYVIRLQWLLRRVKHYQEIRTKSAGRNAVCPCGSGKKFKKCCG